ncbi:MAG: right-handed parallel beta-helix repeat-containing protein [Longimicrobiales bacterium]
MLRSPRSLRILGAVAALLMAACSDQPVGSDGSGEVPDDLLEPALGIVDGNNNDGNAHFFWLKPITDVKPNSFDGVADGTLEPTVEICPRNADGDACDEGPALVNFTRDSGPDRDRIEVNDRDEYFVHWRMNDHAPETGTVYRIRVTLQGQEFGHVDVITLRQRDIKAYVPNPAGDVIPVSDKGALRIGFRIEEGALQDLFCDFDGDGDVEDCDAEVEQAGDGEDTEITVRTEGGDDVVAVVRAPDGVFQDASGNPVPNVVVTAEVEVGPPSEDLLTDNNQELPYFVEINTFPGDVFIDPSGPGVSVVICQDGAELNSRGVVDALHPQLILYKVSDSGTTRRLESTFGAPECAGHVPAPAPSGVLGYLKWGARKLLGVVGPQPLVATRRLHGGLNTTVTRDISLDEAFSTFGAALGPNAAETEAVLPTQGQVAVPVDIGIQVRNALGENLAFAGDLPEVEVVAGPSTGVVASVVDEGAGIYTATYTPLAAGEDTIRIVLTRADGLPLGAIGGSPYTLEIVCALPQSLATVTVTPGANCSTPSEVATFELAMELVQTGGTILANSGTHVVENLVVDRPVTIGEVTGATALIQNDTARQSFLVDGYTSGTVIIEDLDFINNAEGVNAALERSASIRAKGTYDALIVRNNTFTNLPASSNSGARADTTTVSGSTVLVEGNTFTGGRTGFVATGVDGVSDPFVTVVGNTFSGHNSRGVQFQVFSDGNVVDNEMTGCGGACIQYQNSSNGTISGNDVSDCGPLGCIRVFSGTVDVLGNTVTESLPLPADPSAGPFHSAIFYQAAVGAVNGNVLDGCGWGVCIQIAYEAVAEVRDNIINANESDDTEAGIIGFGGFDDDPANNFPPTLTAVTGNVITGVGTGSGTPSDFDYYALKINGIMLRNADAGEVSGNVITNAAQGINVFQNASIASGHDNVVDQTLIAVNGHLNSSVTLTDTDFTNWVQAINDTDGTLTGSLQCNWWGTASGPTGAVSASLSPAFWAPYADGPVANGGPGACAPQAGVYYWDPASGGNGHFYEWVPSGSVPWTTARTAAEARTAYGLPGHLVTITSAAELAFLGTVQSDSIQTSWRPWIGLSDAASEGTYVWVTGEPFSFSSWSAGEPNNLTGEDYVEMFSNLEWNDAPDAHGFTTSYLVEFPTGGPLPAPSPAAVQPVGPTIDRGGSGGAHAREGGPPNQD